LIFFKKKRFFNLFLDFTPLVFSPVQVTINTKEKSVTLELLPFLI